MSIQSTIHNCWLRRILGVAQQVEQRTMEKAQRTSKESSNPHVFTIFVDSDLQERNQTT
jgi:hypothetical protein